MFTSYLAKQYIHMKRKIEKSFMVNVDSNKIQDSSGLTNIRIVLLPFNTSVKIQSNGNKIIQHLI